MRPSCTIIHVSCCWTLFVFLCEYHRGSTGWRLIPRTPSGQLLQTCLHADTMFSLSKATLLSSQTGFSLGLQSVMFVLLIHWFNFYIKGQALNLSNHNLYRQRNRRLLFWGTKGTLKWIFFVLTGFYLIPEQQSVLSINKCGGWRSSAVLRFFHSMHNIKRHRFIATFLVNMHIFFIIRWLYLWYYDVA